MKPLTFYILIFTILLTSCSTNLETSPPNINTPTTKISQQENWQEYINQRFGFSIKFPKSWPRNQGTPDGNGIFLYGNDPNIDIRAYGSVSNPFTEPYGGQFNDPNLKRQNITLDNGKQATLITGKENDSILYFVVLEQAGIFYQLEAHVTKQFFTENEKTLLKVAKSLNILQRSP
ncbi:MAG TPA: hypothetical protein V6D13_11445 [Halomicronema sp.]